MTVVKYTMGVERASESRNEQERWRRGGVGSGYVMGVSEDEVKGDEEMRVGDVRTQGLVWRIVVVGVAVDGLTAYLVSVGKLDYLQLTPRT